MVSLSACGYPQPARPPDAGGGSDARPLDARGIDAVGDAPAGTHNVAATWKIGPVGGNTIGCPSGYDTIALTSRLLDGSGQPTSTAVTDNFTCTQSSGTSSPLQPGKYQVSIAVTNATTLATYATSLPATLDLTIADQQYNTQIYTDGGYFQLAWTLVGATSGQTLTCAQAGAPTVEVISTKSGTSTAYDDKFDCTAGQGITQGLPAVVYTVNVGANNAQNQSLGNLTLNNEQIASPNKVTALGTVAIPIQGM